jgi:hypothetical protein
MNLIKISTWLIASISSKSSKILRSINLEGQEGPGNPKQSQNHELKKVLNLRKENKSLTERIESQSREFQEERTVEGLNILSLDLKKRKFLNQKNN